jgi:hypothetical protein
MALFESYERREKQILAVLEKYDIKSIEECREICQAKGFDPYKITEGIQPICFENAKWAYTVGCAIAIKKGCTRAADAAAAIGEGLQAFCIPAQLLTERKVGLGHGNLGKMLLEEETECFAFLAGHESFAAAEGAIGIAERQTRLESSRFALSLTVSARTLLRLSQELTASHTLKPRWIITPARLRKFSASLIQPAFVQRLTATALTT